MIYIKISSILELFMILNALFNFCFILLLIILSLFIFKYHLKHIFTLGNIKIT